MPRPNRIHVEGGVYHVYNRLGRGERVFEEGDLATAFAGLLRDVVTRDELTVFAWCLMSNHYHLAVRTGPVSLDRPVKTLHLGVTRAVNRRQQVFGPLWQGRYKAKLVNDQLYLDRLLAYIHLNPVAGGIVDDPAEYGWSGHREILGTVNETIVDVDEVLRIFGTTRGSARAAYVRQIKGAIEEEWIGETPGKLPWWRLGRPPKDEEADPETTIRQRRAREEMGPEWRPALKPEEFLLQGAECLEVEVGELRSRRRVERVVRAREMLMLLGVERYGLRVNELARHLGKTPDGVTQAIRRATQKRTNDTGFRSALFRLDRHLAGGENRDVQE